MGFSFHYIFVTAMFTSYFSAFRFTKKIKYNAMEKTNYCFLLMYVYTAQL